MRMLIADDHELFLRGLEMILKDYNQDIELVSARNYSEIFSIIKKHAKILKVCRHICMKALSNTHKGGKYGQARQRTNSFSF